jgi:hypothetical protein
MTCLATRLLIERVFFLPYRGVNTNLLLFISAIPAHILAGALTLIGFSALLLHLVHLRQRRRFFLAASPGSIAHTLSLAAHAQFAHRLYPYDDDDEILRKLGGMRFGLDPRTGAIVADSDGNGEKVVTPVELEMGMYSADSSPGTTVAGKDVEESGAYKFAFGVEGESRLPSEQGSTKQLLLPYRGDVLWSAYLNGSQRASGQFGVNLETRLPEQESTTQQLLPYPGDGANPPERYPPTTDFLPYLGDLSSPGVPRAPYSPQGASRGSHPAIALLPYPGDLSSPGVPRSSPGAPRGSHPPLPAIALLPYPGNFSDPRGPAPSFGGLDLESGYGSRRGEVEPRYGGDGWRAV